MKAAFLSYAHQDNENSGGKILNLIHLVQEELQSRLGTHEFKIYVDRNEHEFGQVWRSRIDGGLAETTVLIPVVSPTYLTRPECRREFDQFFAKEKLILGQSGWNSENRLILPLIFRSVRPDQETDGIWQECQTIIYENIQQITENHRRLRSANVTRFVTKLSSRIVHLDQLIAACINDTTRFQNGDEDDPLLTALNSFSAQLSAWPATLSNEMWLHRDQLPLLAETISSQLTSTRFLVGEPGTGKSAILSQLCKALQTQNFVVLGIKADALPSTIDSMDAFSKFVLGADNQANLVDELIRLSAFRKVVVAIDQLDALANLSDLKSGRLNAMLDLIARLRDNEGIHIVTSIRQFELNADERLRGLIRDGNDVSQELIRLKLLTKTQIYEALVSFGIEGFERWPESYFNFLAAPYHLSEFTSHLQEFIPKIGDIPDAALFSSVQQMHHEKFAVTISISSKSTLLSNALDELIIKILENESHWNFLADFSEEFLASFQELKDLGWLTQQEQQIACAHQTQFEFLSVRRFVYDPSSFVKHVLERENGLFVRPTVWHGLAQMRVLMPTNYLIAMGQLLAQASRRHLKRLLMEFLAEVSQPSVSEVNWVNGFLVSNETFATMCWLIRGKGEWFNEIEDDVFKNMMNRIPDESWPVARLLEASWKLESLRTCDLLLRHWAFRADYSLQLWIVFSDSITVSEEMFNWLLFSANVTPADSWWSNQFLTKLSSRQPEFAYRLLATMLEKRLRNGIVENSNEDLGSVHQDFLVGEHASEAIHNYISNEFFGDRWYVFVEIWQAAPSQFVLAIWPWFIRTMSLLRTKNPFRIRSYCVMENDRNWFGEDNLRGAEIISTLSSCMKEWAKAEQESFIGFVVNNSDINSMTVQRLLAQGLAEIAAEKSDFALAFFRYDTRRFFLGGGDLRGDTWSVIRSAIPFWNRQQICEFQELILNFQIATDQNKEEAECWSDDQIRARFLFDVPSPHRTAQTIQILARHESAIQADDARYRARQSRSLEKEVSPLKSEQMEALPSEELLALLLEKSKDKSDSNSNHRWVLIVEQFKHFSLKHPDRSLAIVQKLQPTDREQAVAVAGIQGLVDSKFSRDKILEHIRSLNSKGFRSEPYCNGIAESLRELAIELDGLPDDLCQMLSEWLTELPFPESNDFRLTRTRKTEVNDYDSSSATSLLWNRSSRLHILPAQWFPIGEAVKLGYCLSEPSRHEKWLGVMHACVERPFPVSVWEAWLSGVLRYDPCPEQTAKLVVEVLEKRTDVLHTDMGVASVAMFANWLPESKRNEFLHQLVKSDVGIIRQGAGEVAAFIHLSENDLGAKELIENSLTNRKNDSELDEFRIGVAFTASHEWRDEEFQEAAVDLLVRLTYFDNEGVQHAILTAFYEETPLLDNSPTQQLLEACASHFDFRKTREAYWLIKHLRRFVNLNPELTYRVMRRFIDSLLAMGRTESQRISFYEDEVSNIVLTLHRQSNSQLKSDSLTLYEDLLDLEVTGAYEKLRELDFRPKFG